MDFFYFLRYNRYDIKEGKAMFNNDETCFENVFSYPGLNDLNMYYCGKRIKTPNHSYGPEVRKHFLIVYIKEGTGVLLSENENIDLLPGSILVMFPNKKTHYVVNEGQLWSISWVGVFGEQIYGFFDKIGVTPENPVLRLKNSKIVENIFEEIYDLSLSEQQSDKITVIGLLYKFFSCIVSYKELKSDRNCIDEIINIIEYNYDKNININTLAKNIYMNPSYLSRLFREEKGITLKEYILQKKIERAKELLRRKNISVKMVSNSVGFTDPLYFSRIFKRKTGLSPLEFKNIKYDN